MRDMNLQNFTYNELETATGGFDEELGRGAFGPVYKGVLGGEDKQIIAVKRLEKMAGEGETEFKTEVTVIGRTNHKNLVQLVGFCNEGQHRLLVYEYMSGGSLSNYIFGDSRPNWHRRLQIAFGVARGLLYLHEECSSQIIHCDIKPQNILLDESFNARISDFGLAKLLKTEQSKTITVIRGTKGYVAPEWFKNLPVTAKVDTYSFGILLLELVCCRKNFEINAREEHQIVLADWACDCFKEGKLNLLVEEDEEAMEDMKRVERFVMVAIWCIQEDPSLRPAMKKVVQMLEGDPSIGDKALMKVSKGNWTAKKRDRSALIVPGSVLLGSSIFLNVLSVLGIYLFFTRWIRQKQIVIPQHHLTPAPDMNLRNFTYNIELETATGGFDEELGRGAFGPVYKGVLGDEDKQMIAVKKIHCYKYVSSKILGMASASFTLMFLATMVLLQLMAVAQTDGSKPVGASITANDDAPSWLSSSGEFAFGFRQMENKDYFLLSIWYEKIPEKTVVWYAMGEDPTDDLAVSRGSKVELTADSGLVLTDPQGNRIWSSGGFLGTVSSGVMNDTGNFVLQDRNSDRLWESFTHPTDTLLPTQIMEAGGIVSSRRTETNFSLGRFQLRFLDNGNLVLNAMNFPTKFAYDAYYTSQTSDDSNSLNSGYRLIFNESGYMYILRRNGLREDLTEGTVPTDFYHRATLNFDGVFTQYFYPKASSGNRSWSSVWSKPDNICVGMGSGLGSGVCGYNSICDLKADKRPECNCPPGFSLLDQNDKYGSCIPDFELGCRSDGLNSTEDQYDFTALINVDWPTSDYERYKPYTEEECRKSCLNDCLCSVAIFRDGCWKKKLPLSNGRLNAGMNGKAFLKFRKGSVPLDRSRLPLPGDKKKPDTKLITGSVVLGTSVFVNFVLVGAFCLTSSFIYRKKTEKTPEGGSCLETNLRYFSYKELAEATNDFKDELGRGVYKGTIQAGSTKVVAVKKLTRVVQDGEKEFKTEVQVIGQTHHKNLARLLGFCDEGQNRLLVYEFLSNGTLANFLFGSLRPSWKQRTQIAFGIARGLLYLHEECGTQIIHCDIKPQNILLDDYYNARISDFGLAKLLAMDQSKTQTAMRGTKGYISPEWFRNKPITVKVDVYSFGVILLEIICCRRSVDLEMGEAENPVLTDWAYDCYVNGTLDVLIGDDTEAMNDMSTLERLLKVGIWCIQEEPSLRPTMRKVTQMLEGVIEVPAAPNPYPYMNERRVDSERENADDAYDDAYESYERVDADLSGVSAADMGMNAGDNADVTLRGAAGSARGAPGSADGGAHGSTPGSADFHFFILSSIYFTKTMDLNKTSYNKKLTHQTPLHHYTMLVSTYAWLEVFLWYAGGNTIFIYLLFFFFVSNWFFLVF
uniref:non-specific serine/threonine protein kinase n=1 Tax=Salix viminalis TaxID=40686 RepID=A0A6N2K6L4_SALVM